MPKQTTGEFMATLRKANGYTQQEVAEKLNISNRTLSSWETDRTLPDVLMLPAIADLYKITVDELLRGEKINHDDKAVTTPSDESLKSIRKQRYGKFCSRALLLGCISVMCEMLIVFICALAVANVSPLWVSILIGALGGAGLCASLIIARVCYINVKLAEGIVTNDDYNEKNKPFVFAIKYKLSKVFRLCSIPPLLAATVFSITFLIVNPSDIVIDFIRINNRQTWITVICLNLALGITLFTAYLCLCLSEVKLLSSDKQYETFKNNRRIIKRLAIFGAIPVALVLVINLSLAFAYKNDCKTLYENENFDEFRTHIQTLVVDEGEGAPSGEYYLPIPTEKPKNGAEFDFGNGFYGVYHTTEFTSSAINYTEEYWTITYGKGQTPIQIGDEAIYLYDNVPTWDLSVYDLDDNKFVVNARYYWHDHVYDRYGNASGAIRVTESEGTYYLLQDISTTLINIAKYTLTIVPIATIITCTLIYAAKRKKQKYNF